MTDRPASEFADTALHQVYGHRDPVQAGSALATTSATAALAVPSHHAPVMNPIEQHSNGPTSASTAATSTVETARCC